MEDKIKGALYGLCIGDAMGAPVEYLSKELIKKRYKRIVDHRSGFLGIPFFLRLKGMPTDDTRMSLALLKGLLKNPEQPRKGISRQFNKQRLFPLFVGKTLLYDFFFYFGDWEKTARFVDKLLKGRTAGNGALMRSLPVALVYDEIEKMKKETENQAKMTHWNETSTRCCLLYNEIAFRVLRGEEMKKVIMDVIKGTEFESCVEKPSYPPNGYSVATLQWVLYGLYRTESFEEAILSAVNEGGDADTIASLVGGIAGLAYGFSSIPEKWIKGLRVNAHLNKLTERIMKVRENENNNT